MAQEFFAVHEIPNSQVGWNHILSIYGWRRVRGLCGQFTPYEEEEKEEEYRPMTIDQF